MKSDFELEAQIEKPNPLSCKELVKIFESKEKPPLGELINFSGVDGRDVYNITSPHKIGNKTVIAGRVENRESIAKSQIFFFEKKGSEWVPSEGAPKYTLEDGFLAQIKGETIFGGVEVYPKPTKENPDGVGYRTVFYRGNDISSFRKFATGPDMMKDIRLLDLENGKIGVFTRPQGEIGGRGKLGYIEIEKLEDLNDSQKLLGASILENQFAPDEWGGANDLHLLKNEKIGVVGHIAYQDEKDDKHYYAMSFTYDTKTHTASPISIFATVKNFPDGEAKSSVLRDIVFPSNLVRNGDGTAVLYAGLRDSQAGFLNVSDQFTE